MTVLGTMCSAGGQGRPCPYTICVIRRDNACVVCCNTSCKLAYTGEQICTPPGGPNRWWRAGWFCWLVVSFVQTADRQTGWVAGEINGFITLQW